jgi:hypothetical protein
MPFLDLQVPLLLQGRLGAFDMRWLKPERQHVFRLRPIGYDLSSLSLICKLLILSS